MIRTQHQKRSFDTDAWVSNDMYVHFQVYRYWNSKLSLELDFLGIPVFKYWRGTCPSLTVFGLKIWRKSYEGLKVLGIRVTSH